MTVTAGHHHWSTAPSPSHKFRWCLCLVSLQVCLTQSVPTTGMHTGTHKPHTCLHIHTLIYTQTLPHANRYMQAHTDTHVHTQTHGYKHTHTHIYIQTYRPTVWITGNTKRVVLRTDRYKKKKRQVMKKQFQEVVGHIIGDLPLSWHKLFLNLLIITLLSFLSQ